MMDAKGVKKRVNYTFLFLLISILILFASASHDITPTSFSVNEEVSNFYNITINNTDTGQDANITQVNITLPNSFIFTTNTNGTNTPFITFINNSTILSWTNSSGYLINGSTNNSYFWFNATASQPGVYNIIVTTLNSTGTSSSNISITVNDTTKPTTNLNFPVNDYNSSSSIVTFNCTASDNYNLSSVSLYGNWSGGWHLNQTNSSGINGTDYIWTKTLMDGNYFWNCYSNDTSGNYNWENLNYSLLVDTTNPLISYGIGTENSSSNKSQNWIYVNVSVTEINEKNITFYLYNSGGSLNTSQTFTNATRDFNFTDLAEGIYYYNVTIFDEAGNRNDTATRTITLDTTIPSLTNITITGAYYNGTDNIFSPTINGIYDNVSINLRYSETVNASIYVVNSFGSIVQTLYPFQYVQDPHAKIWNGMNDSGSIVPTGIYTINTTITDYAGNSNTTSVATVYVDNTGPNIGGLNETPSPNNKDESVFLNATINDNFVNVSSVWLSGNWTGSWENYSISSSTQVYSYLIDAGNFSNQQFVNYQWFANDSLGNFANSSVQSFQVANRNPVFNSTLGNKSMLKGSKFIGVYNLSQYFSDPDGDNFTYASLYGTNLTITINQTTGIVDIESTGGAGNITLAFTATDVYSDVGTSNNVTIEVNDTVICSNFGTISLNEDNTTEFDLDDYCSGSGVTYALGVNTAGSNLTIILNSTIGVVNLTPVANWYGISIISFSAIDGSSNVDSTSGTITINSINDAPVINNVSLANNSILNLTPLEDFVTYTFNLTPYETDVDLYDTDSNLTWSLSGVNISIINITLNQTTDVLTFVSVQNSYGSDVFTLTLNDSFNATDSINLTINVQSVNDAPVINSSINTSYSTNEDVAFTINLGSYETDVDNYDVDANLTWSISGANSSLVAVNVDVANDILIVVPAADQSGSDAMTLTLTDSQSATDSVGITITITPVNDAPILSSIGQQDLTVNQAYFFTVNTTDIDAGDILTFSDNTTLFNINSGTGVINFTPSIGQNGTHYVNILVNDSSGAVDSEVVLFNITFKNNAPVANNVVTTTNEDTSVSIPLNCTDADNNSLTYSIVSNPLNGTLSGSSSSRTYNPNSNFFGIDSFNYRCYDGLNYSLNATVTITIASVNDAPSIDSFSPTDTTPTIKVNTFQTFVITKSDVESSSLSVQWKVGGVNVSGATNNSYNYSATTTGTFAISVDVSDSANTTSQSWTLTVIDKPIATGFSGSTTNFAALSVSQLNSVSNVVLEKVGTGKIEFQSAVDLRNVVDFDDVVKIQNSVFAIDIANYPELNVPARLTLNGLSYTTFPEVLYASSFTTNTNSINQACDFCDIVNFTQPPTTSGIVIFDVSHFTSFRIAGSGALIDVGLFDSLDTCKNDIQGNLTVTIRDPNDGDNFNPGEIIDIEVKVENDADERLKIVVEAILYNTDEDNEEADEKSNDKRINSMDSETIKLEMTIPEDFTDGDDYILFAKAYDKGNEDVQCNYDLIDLDLEREDYDLKIESVSLSPMLAYPGEDVDFFVEVLNEGSNDEGDIFINVSNEELGISESIGPFEIEAYDEDDTLSKRINIVLPENLEKEEYIWTIKVKGEESEDSISKTLSISPNEVIIEVSDTESIKKKDVAERALQLSNSELVVIDVFLMILIGTLIILMIILKKR